VFRMVSVWDSLDAIEIFAGTPADQARYYDFDDEFLIEKDPKVLHVECWAS